MLIEHNLSKQLIRTFNKTLNRVPEIEPLKKPAVVALIINQRDPYSICFIERAQRKGDPWSGHVALPGGKISRNDKTLVDGVIRETYEEIGIQLKEEFMIGNLGAIEAPNNLSGKSFHIIPFVFLVRDSLADTAFVASPKEVASFFWVPIDLIYREKGLTTIEYAGIKQKTYPAIPYKQYFIWGLTLRVLRIFNNMLKTEVLFDNQ